MNKQSIIGKKVMYEDEVWTIIDTTEVEGVIIARRDKPKYLDIDPNTGTPFGNPDDRYMRRPDWKIIDE